jgi:DNA-3-methyladenine glycosylase
MNFKDLVVLEKEFFLKDSQDLAINILGKYLVRMSEDNILIAKIVETESYSQDDPASHSYKGKTKRCLPMFLEGGISYVYFIYGMYFCFNVVTNKEGIGSAVLIRAVEPINFISTSTNGPAKLCKSFNINKDDNQKCLITSDLRIMESMKDTKDFEIIKTRRIGIKKSIEQELRFYIKGNNYVSHN